MKLALEVPTAYLPDFIPLTDMDFALSHRVLADDAYAEFYCNRRGSRKLILDNSMHELGHPLSPVELLEAATRCRADYVIPPDKLGEFKQNYDWFKETARIVGNRFKVAVVMCGRDPGERTQFIHNVKSADMLCMPYREFRLDWMQQHWRQISTHWNDIHLLGVSSLAELRGWSFWTTFNLSVDTRKPIKWGVQRKKLNELESLRGSGDLLTNIDCDSVRALDCAQRETILWNIAHLRTHMV